MAMTSHTNKRILRKYSTFRAALASTLVLWVFAGQGSGELRKGDSFFPPLPWEHLKQEVSG